MCRSIKPLFNYDPPTTNKEIQEASLQFVRKVSGFREPSKANKGAFDTAIEEISLATKKLLDSLVANSKPHNRGHEQERKKFTKISL